MPLACLIKLLSRGDGHRPKPKKRSRAQEAARGREIFMSNGVSFRVGRGQIRVSLATRLRAPAPGASGVRLNGRGQVYRREVQPRACFERHQVFRPDD